MNWYSIVFYILIGALVLESLALLFIYLGKKKTGVQYRPVPRWLFPHIAQALNPKTGSVVYDLGCGESLILRYLLKNSKDTKAVGIELTPIPYFIARFLNTVHPLRNLEIIKADFFNVKINDATHIFLYLLPPLMDKLLPKLEKELKSGTRLVSCDFRFTHRAPSKIISLQGEKQNHELIVYEF